jgi:amino acid transporter/nucleotide-binding universal stress UspA family protein
VPGAERRERMAGGAELQRDLGFWGALTIGAGTMIGAGIFLLAGVALEQTGPGAILSYLIAGTICFLTAASTAELATGMPTSGGDYYFVSRGLGPALGAISGVGIWLSLTVAIAFYLVGLGDFVSQLAPVTPLVGALAGAVALTVLNVLGAKQSGSAQIVVVLALIAILGVFVAGGAFALETDNFTPLLPYGGSPVLATTALVFVSFLGFVKIAAVSEEIQDPDRNLPRALMGSVALVTVLYVLIVGVIAGIFDQTRIVTVPDPLTQAARLVFGTVGGQALIVAGLLATLSSANASILASSRINLAMSRDALFPSGLARIHPRLLTPSRAIVLTGVLAIVLIVALPNLEELAKIASSLQLYSYAALNVACVALRASAPDWYRPTFRVPLTPLPQLVGAVGCLTIIGFSGPIAQLSVVALIVLSLAWYAARRAQVDIDHGLVALRLRWGQLGVQSLFVAPEPAARRGGSTAVQRPPLERIIGPRPPRRVMVALANPATEGGLLGLARLVATGAAEGGEVLGVHLRRVPPQTPITVARDQFRERRDIEATIVHAATASGTANGRSDTAEPVPYPTRRTEVAAVTDVAHDIHSGLVDAAAARRADLLLLGWHGGFSLGRISATPVRRVMAGVRTDLAVLQNRGLDLSGLRRIVLPWGGGPHARLGLELAVRIARTTGARIELLRVVRGSVDREREERVLARAVEELTDGAEVVVRVLHGESVTDTIDEFLQRDPPDLMVIGASQEAGLRSMLFGTLPDVVADRAPGSVLLVRRYVPERWLYRLTRRLRRTRDRLGMTSSAEVD